MARFTLDLDALACVLIQRLAVFFERRVHGRNLRLRAGKALRHGLQQFGRDVRHGPGFNHFAFRIGSGGFLAQQQHGFIGLVSIELQLAELGGRSKAQRQHASGQRVERAGVTGLVGAQQPFGLLQRLVARQAQRLVEQQHAMHGTSLDFLAKRGFGLRHKL